MRHCSTRSPLSSARIPDAAVAAVLVLGALVATDAGARSFSSGARQVDVVELYTSEGCSSCPPADRWLSGLKAEPGLWTEFVPLGFHVDYWDYIGWRDRFASPEHSARQRRYARAGGLKSVYTPGFVVNGREWRGWFRGASRPASSQIVGPLNVDIVEDVARIRFRPVTTDGPFHARVALLGTNLATEVRAGENRGRQLVHDFVVLSDVEVPLAEDGDAWRAEAPLAPLASDVARGGAIAVWVTAGSHPAPVQATGGWLAP